GVQAVLVAAYEGGLAELDDLAALAVEHVPELNAHLVHLLERAITKRGALHQFLVQDLQSPADADRAEDFGGLAGQVGAVNGSTTEAAATAEGLGVLRVCLLDSLPKRQVVLAHVLLPLLLLFLLCLLPPVGITHAHHLAASRSRSSLAASRLYHSR